MDRTQLIDFGLCVAFAAFFSAGKAYADSHEKVHGWALFKVILASMIMGCVGGMITVPLTDVLHAIFPTPDARNRSARLLIAAVIGWAGLKETMAQIEAWIKKFTKDKAGGLNPYGTDVPQTPGPGAGGTGSLENPSQDP